MKLADIYYQSLLDTAKAEHAVANYLEGKQDFASWKGGLLGALEEVLGGRPGEVPLDIRRGDVEELEGFTRERLVFTSEEGLSTPAYLLLPEGANEQTPVAVALHGHGWGVKAIVGLRPDGSPLKIEDEYQRNFALALVNKGFAVIAPELLGFGELRMGRDDENGERANSCHNLSTLLISVGRTMAGVRTWQAHRSLTLMRALGFAGKAVAMGISGGGLVCTYLAALDERVLACCISGFGCTYRGSIFTVHHCVDNYQPNTLNAFEEPDVLSAIAPRPMLWEAGENDPIFPIEGVVEAQRIIGEVYKKQGAGEHFVVDRFEGEHEISGAVAYDFLLKGIGE